MSAHTTGTTLMRRARTACEEVATGPFTPIVFERYEFIGGERGVRLGRPIEFDDGRLFGIDWTNRATGSAS